MDLIKNILLRYRTKTSNSRCFMPYTTAQNLLFYRVTTHANYFFLHVVEAVPLKLQVTWLTFVWLYKYA